MKAYLNLLQNILDDGVWQKNRTGIDTLMIPGAMLKADLREGFPALTTKKLAFNAVKGELIGFLRGCDTAKEFRDLGCKVWDANANAPAWTNSPAYQRHVDNKQMTEEEAKEEGFLGRCYGKQWTDWNTSELKKWTDWGSAGGKLNQVERLIEQIKTNPTSRRLLVSAWRPDELDQMALPPCHFAFQILIEQETKEMNLIWNQRSADVFLGIGFNLSSYALLLSIIAAHTGYTPKFVIGMLGDVHLYRNHLDQVKEQLSRTPFSLPKLQINRDLTSLVSIADVEPSDFELVGYECHAAIKAEMAV